jgi:hypothetical protein
MIAIGAKQPDLLVAKLLIVTIKLPFALRTGYPEDFYHGVPQRKKIRNSNIEIRNNCKA